MTANQRAERVLKEISGVASLYDVKSADQRFLHDLESRKQNPLSEAQERWLVDIEQRVFGKKTE